jgi:Thermostable hemolysin
MTAARPAMRMVSSIGTDDALSVSITAAGAAMDEGLEFCARKYQATYDAAWVAKPDLCFVARRGGRVVSTAALELGAKRPQIDTERYFRLSPGMRAFIESRRERIAEFGRFSSDDPAGTKAVILAAISFCRQAAIDYFFAWANPAVYTYVEREIGLSFSAIDVPVNEEAVRTDTTWTAPPVRFFLREDPPRLLVGIVPFLDVASWRLAADYGAPVSLLV